MRKLIEAKKDCIIFKWLYAINDYLRGASKDMFIRGNGILKEMPIWFVANELLALYSSPL